MAGYSGTPLIQKLGIKSGFRICVINAPANYLELLGELPSGVEHCGTSAKRAVIDFVHVFARERADLATAMPKLIKQLSPSGMIWVSWPKKASKVPTTITEAVIREIALPLGMVDIKVCAVDEVWSGLKLVIRKQNRPAAR